MTTKSNLLSLITTDNTKKNPATRKLISKKQIRKAETQAKLDRQWHQNSKQYDPHLNCRTEDQFLQTIRFIEQQIDLKGKKVIDLGSGTGKMSREIKACGASVEALDGSILPLKQIDDKAIITHHEILPDITLPSHSYDVVICSNVIAELHPHEHRLLLAEIHRILKPGGVAVLTTELDIDTDNAFEALQAVVETELNIKKIQTSYHGWQIRLTQLLKFASPLQKMVNTNHWLLKFLEKGCRNFNRERGKSFVIFLGEKRDHFKGKQMPIFYGR